MIARFAVRCGWGLLIGFFLFSSVGRGATNDEIIRTIDEFFFRVEQLEFAQYLARAAILSGQPEDLSTHCLEILSILSESPKDGLASPHASSLDLLDWVDRAAADPVLLLAVRPSLQASTLYNHSLVLDYLELALAECEQLIRMSSTTSGRELHMKKAYAFLSAALGTADSTFSVRGLKSAEAMLPSEVIFLKPGESIQEAADNLAPGGAIFLAPGEYHDEGTLISSSIWISKAPNTSMQVRIVGQSNLPVFLMQGEQVDIELSDITIADGYSGVRLEGSVSCWMTNCVIIDNKYAGIVASENSVVMIANSRIRRNFLYGLLASHEARIGVIDCDISLNVFINTQLLGAGIAASDQVVIHVQDCFMIGNAGYGILLRGTAVLAAEGLKIIYSKRSGVHLEQGAGANISASHLAINGIADLSTYNEACYSQHDESWSIERAFIGTLEGAGNSTEIYNDDLRTCLGNDVLPEGFFSVIQQQ